jgi:superfamily II DNA/RNA helicase
VQNNEEAPLAETQVLFVGATLPKIQPSSPVGSLVNTEQLKILRTGQLHRVLPHVKQKFIRAPKVKREEYLLRVVEKDIKAGNPVIIFSNKASTSNFIAHVINDRFGNSLNKDEGDEVNEEQRSNVCIAFNSSVYWRKRAEVLKKFTNGDIGVLSCTDLASRGLNLDGRATHVINYDFPSNLSDYLHRVGRVGRVGQSKIGKVTSLVCGQVSISVAQELERSVRLNIELPNVDANVPSLIQQRHAEVETSDEWQNSDYINPMV